VHVLPDILPEYRRPEGASSALERITCKDLLINLIPVTQPLQSRFEGVYDNFQPLSISVAFRWFQVLMTLSVKKMLRCVRSVAKRPFFCFKACTLVYDSMDQIQRKVQCPPQTDHKPFWRPLSCLLVFVCLPMSSSLNASTESLVWELGTSLNKSIRVKRKRLSTISSSFLSILLSEELVRRPVDRYAHFNAKGPGQSRFTREWNVLVSQQNTFGTPKRLLLTCILCLYHVTLRQL